jgi:broad specificity phosphatase PhoE
VSARLLLVRHGETAPNRRGVLLGRADPELTPEGQRQAELLGVALAPATPRLVVTSPLRRARATAAAIARWAGTDLVVDERLVEVDYGSWEGRRLDELPAAVVGAWRSDPARRPPGGESLADVGTRVGSLAAALLGDGGTVVAVSHVSPIKAAVAWALGVDDGVAWRMHLGLASVTRLGVRPDGTPYLEGFNDTGHLAGRA